jgi:glycerol-3-phosphate dehydrogenase
MPEAPTPPESDCDVLVIGGGVNGAGIARDLAGRGWRVLLAERGDLAQATSSASSKLIHGGLRYLEQYESRPTSPGRCASCCRTGPRCARAG